jgi:hypothetical protein
VARIRLGDLLVKAGLIDELQLQSALAHQRQWGGKLGDILVNNGFLDEMMLWRGLSKQLGVPLVSLPDHKFTPGIERQIPLDLCLQHSIFPLQRDDKGLTIATSDPGNIGGIDEVAFRLGARLKLVLAPDREVEWAIRHYLQGDPSPCPPARLRRIGGESASPTAAPAAPMEVTHLGRDTGTPMAQLAGLAPTLPPRPASQTGLPAVATAPPAPSTWSIPPAAAPASMPSPSTWSLPPQTQPPVPATSDAERLMRETAHVLRFLVEACIARGVFTREEYLAKLKTLR